LTGDIRRWAGDGWKSPRKSCACVFSRLPVLLVGCSGTARDGCHCAEFGLFEKTRRAPILLLVSSHIFIPYIIAPLTLWWNDPFHSLPGLSVLIIAAFFLFGAIRALWFKYILLLYTERFSTLTRQRVFTALYLLVCSRDHSSAFMSKLATSPVNQKSAAKVCWSRRIPHYHTPGYNSLV
jgi:hypothetical protein